MLTFALKYVGTVTFIDENLKWDVQIQHVNNRTANNLDNLASLLCVCCFPEATLL